MNKEELYQIFQAISLELASTDDAFKPLPITPNWSASLEDLEIDIITAQEYFQQLETRIPTKKFHVPAGLIDQLQRFYSLGELFDYLMEKCFEKQTDYEIVYVDDEPENLFVFKRKYGKRLNLKTFEDPQLALDYIIKTPKIALVITDEVMPRMSGNELCDEVRKIKPNLKFVLITGNPNQDEDLMYRSLRKNRFYEFINKPMDFERKGEEYFAMIQGLISFDW